MHPAMEVKDLTGHLTQNQIEDTESRTSWRWNSYRYRSAFRVLRDMPTSVERQSTPMKHSSHRGRSYSRGRKDCPASPEWTGSIRLLQALSAYLDGTLAGEG